MNQHLNTQAITILNDLKRLGFTDYEAKIYIALLGKSPATAYELAHSSGVPRANTYSALKALAAREAAMPVSENPIRYVPQPPDRLFGSIAAQTSDLCQAVSDNLSALTLDSGEHYVWDLRGEANVHAKVSDMIACAESAVWFKADSGVLRQHSDELRDATVDRGVRLMIILYGTDPDEFRFNDLCEVYEHEGSGFPMGFADNSFTLTVDHRAMLAANRDDTLIAAHTENRAIVKMAISLLRHDYYMAEIFRALAPQIDAEFGPNLRKLRQHSYSPEQFELFQERQEEQSMQSDGKISR